jgi:transcriptional regulator with XRE-family HTH domain
MGANKHKLLQNFLYSNAESAFILIGMSESISFQDRLRTVLDRLGTRRDAAMIAGVSLDAVIRYLRGENQPSFAAIGRLCQAAGISMHWLATGQGPAEWDAAKGLSDQTTRGLPVSGFSESKESGWYTTLESAVQTTLDLPDPHAFAALVHGQGLVPEGLHAGFMCICSPQLKTVQGDIVHLKRHDGLCALRIFIREEGEWLILKADSDTDDKNQQVPYEDKVKRSVIAEMAPVVFIRRKM